MYLSDQVQCTRHTQLGTRGQMILGDPCCPPAAGHSKWVWDCVFSVDAAYLVTASSDCTARLWDLSSGEAIRVYSGHHKVHHERQPTPSQTLTHSASSNCTVFSRDASDGAPMEVDFGHHDGHLRSPPSSS